MFSLERFQALIVSLGQNKLVRQVSILAGGSAAANAVNMLFYPLLTRIYGPEGYGLQSVVVTTATLVATLAAFSYPLAIVLPKQDSVAFGLAKMSLGIAFFISLLVAVAVFFWGEMILVAINATEIIDYSFLVPFLVIVAVFSSVVTQWLVRHKFYKLIAKITLLTAIFSGIVKAGIGIITPTALTLIVISTVTGVLSAVAMYMSWRRSGAAEIDRSDGIVSNKIFYPRIAREYIDFAILRTPQNFIVAASQSVPIYFLSYYFSAEKVGFYSIASTALALPAAVVGGAAMHVFYPRLNEIHQAGGDCKSLLKKATIGMLTAGVLPFVIIGLSGPYIFGVVFGSGWNVAGEYARWLAFSSLIALACRPAVTALVVFRLQGTLLALEVISIVLKLASLYFVQKIYGDDVFSIAAYSVISIVHGLLLISFAFYASSNQALSRSS